MPFIFLHIQSFQMAGVWGLFCLWRRESWLVLLQGFIDFCKTSHLLVEENAQKRGEVTNLRQWIARFQAAITSTAKWLSSPGSAREHSAGPGEVQREEAPLNVLSGPACPMCKEKCNSVMHSFTGIIILVCDVWLVHCSGPRSGPMCGIIKWQIKSVNRINWVDVILLIRWIWSLLRWIRIH